MINLENIRIATLKYFNLSIFSVFNNYLKLINQHFLLNETNGVNKKDLKCTFET